MGFLVLFFNLENVTRLLREIVCSGSSTGRSRINHTPTSRIRLARVTGAESAPCAPLTRDESWSPDHSTRWFWEEHPSHSGISLLASARASTGRLLHYHLFYFYILTVIFCYFYKLKNTHTHTQKGTLHYFSRFFFVYPITFFGNNIDTFRSGSLTIAWPPSQKPPTLQFCCLMFPPLKQMFQVEL